MIQASDPFLSVCRISREGFAEAIRSRPHNPGLDEQHELGAYWDESRAWSVDPLFILAMAIHESQLMTAGVAASSCSWGNTRAPSFGAVPIDTMPGRTGHFPVWQDFRDGCASTAARLASPIWPTGAPYGSRASIREVFDHPSGATWAPAGDLNDPHAYLATMLRLMNEYTDQDDEWIAATKAPTPPVYQDYLTVNYTRGRNAHIVKALVLHVTQGASAAGCINWFKNPTSEVSSHYVIDRDGDIYATVRERDQAWMNGRLETPNVTIPIVAEWAATGRNPNLETVGVEVAGYSSQQPAGQPPELVGYTEAQFDALAFLLPVLGARHMVPLAPDWLFGHNEISGRQRANCPGLSPEEWDRIYAAAPPVAESANRAFDEWCATHGTFVVWRGDYVEHAHWAGADPAPVARTADDHLLVSNGVDAWSATGLALDEWETAAQYSGQLVIYRDEGG